MTNAAQSPNDPFGTLGKVNARLKMLGFAQIGSEQAQNILGQVPRHRLVSALTEAHVNQGARRFLETLIPSAQNEPEQGQSVQQRQPAPPAQQQHRQPAQHSAQPQGGQSMPPSQGAQHSAPPPERRNAAPQQQGYKPHGRGSQSTGNSGGQPAPNAQSRNASPQQGQDGEREYMSHHVYGGKAALCWDVDQTRNGDSTIRLEAAKVIGERKYDWSNKITIQLTRDELPCVAAVFLGILQRTEGRNHGVGDQQGKGFEIEHQGNKLFVKVFAPQRPPCAVPISPEDAFTVASLLVRQIRKGKPWLSGNDIMTMLRAIIGRMKSQTGNQ